MEDPQKAAAFDEQHKEGPKWGRHHAGAKELASGYTAGTVFTTVHVLEKRAQCVSGRGTIHAHTHHTTPQSAFYA